MSGEADKLIEAASGAVKRTISFHINEQGVSDCFLFDCVSRQLFLQNLFSNELDLIHREINPPHRTVGALVLGEIELDQSGILSLHNKTAVAALAKIKSHE